MANLRFLIAENNPLDALLLRSHLRKIFGDGFKETVLSRLSDTKIVLGDYSFDLILLDLGLDDSHGLITLKEIVTITSIPILVITGADYPDGQIKELGAKGYLNKNRLHEDIEKCVKTLLENKIDKLSKHERTLSAFNTKLQTSALVRK